MKPFAQRNLRTQISILENYRWSVIIIAGIMSLSMAMVSCTATGENPVNPSPETQQYQEDSLPSSLADAVLEEVSSQTKIPRKHLSITETSRETWSNGCLGLGQPNEFCTQALVEGWQILITDGSQTWVYRTDMEGQSIRWER